MSNPKEDRQVDTGSSHDLQPEEYYVEPPQLGRGDILGVIGALIALALIGVAGYIWLNPALSFDDVTSYFSRSSAPSVGEAQYPKEHPEPHQHESESSPTGESDNAPSQEQGEVGSAGMDAETTAPLGSSIGSEAARAERPRCATCGMFTDHTLGVVEASWSDGSRSSHDCWTCAMEHATEDGLTLVSATVLAYTAGLDQRKELDAKSSWFLYGTSVRIEGSMPPFIAAFASKVDAEASAKEMGGEVADFSSLMERLSPAGGNK